MSKILSKVFFAVFCAFLLAAAGLRCVQLIFMTDSSTGFIIKDYAGTILMFFVLCLASLFSAGCFIKCIKLKNPMQKSNSKLLFYSCLAAGAAMFYDFVHQCVNCFNYFYKGSAAGLNYFIPLCFCALCALMCAFYFVMMGISFKTKQYDFRNFRYYHLMPVLWNLFFLFSRLSDYNDGIYDEESMLLYAALIIGLLFFIELALSVSSDYKKIRFVNFLGVFYGSLCFLLSAPRFAAFILKADMIHVDYSALTYLLMVVFSFSLPVAALKKDVVKEG